MLASVTVNRLTDHPMPLPKTHLDTKATLSTPMTPFKGQQQEANGAAGEVGTGAVDATVSHHSPANVTQMPAKQTHGAIIPSAPRRGNVSSVGELLGKPVAKGSVGTFDTLESYSSYIQGLTQGELHRHAIEEAHIVPIAERSRLLRRLESEYTAIASRTPQHRAAVAVQQPKGYSQEQMNALDAIQRKLKR